MAINPLLFPAGMANLMGAKAAPAAPAAPTAPVAPAVSPQQAYLDNMRRIASGDLKSVLSGGDRLMALSALLGSVARGSRTTPQEAMAQVQQTAANKVNTQMQLAQLEMKAQQDAALAANRDAIVRTLPQKFQEQAKAMDPEKLGTWLSNLRMQPSYKRVTEDGKTKTKVVYLQSGLEEDAAFELPANLEKGYLGGQAVWFDKDTGRPFIDPTTGQPARAGDPMTPKDTATLALQQRREARMSAPKPRSGGGAGVNLLPEPKEVVIDGKPTMMQWDKKIQRYVPFRQQNVSKPKSGFTPTVPVSIATGRPLIRQ